MKYNLVELMQFESFGKLVFVKRKEADLTQEELHEITKKFQKVSKSYISTIENKRPHSITEAPSKPDKDVVISLVNALNTRLALDRQIDINEALLLAGYAPDNFHIPEEILVLFRDAEKWSERKRKAIIQAIINDVELINNLIWDDSEET